MTKAKATSKRSKGKAGSAQVPPTRATSKDSATGQAIRVEEHKVPTGKDRGSTAPGAGEATEAGGKPQGAQAEPAKFTSNGSLPHGMLPTNSGPVPASAVHATKEAADKAVDENEDAVATQISTDGGQRLSDATVGRIGRAELQAIAHTRGYEIDGMLGTRGTRNAFLKAQAEDKTLKTKEPGSVYETRSAGSARKR